MVGSMKFILWIQRGRLCGLALAALSCFGPVATAGEAPVAPRYEFRSDHDPNGIGKFYWGREIAMVMGHPAADWLERAGRQDEERPDLLIAALDLKAGDQVADIGCGTGYYTWRLAEKVGKKGLVYAVDIQPEMLDLLDRNMSQRKLENYRKVLGAESDPKLPDQSTDLILMVDVYHEFSAPFEMVQAMCRALKPGGRVVFVEFRAEDPKVPIKEVHKMSEAQVRREMAVQSLEWVQTIKTLPWQHLVVFRKR
jgi:ubiquinone/menaquinone biosynthesis C-methylase UbiE